MPTITEGGLGGIALSQLASQYRFTHPAAIELKFETERHLLEGRSAIEIMVARIWVNTLEAEKSASHRDAMALQDPAAHWGRLLNMGVNMIQTDYPAALLE